ncbi:hypothetical protein EP7_004621 [Isosphaeraceae bacterium EP7]
MSRLRSTRGAKAPSRPAGGRPGVFVQSPQSDIYVVMLSIALGAILLGCLLLALIMNQYGFSTQVSSLVTETSSRLLA